MQRALRESVAELDDAALRESPHPELSPPGWHLGHCCFIELYWTGERTQDHPASGGPVDLYWPQRSPKPERGRRLPQRAALLAWCEAVQRHTLSRLEQAAESLPLEARAVEDPEPLYLLWFLLQHHAQHLETLRMIHAQRALAASSAAPGAALIPCPPSSELVRLPPGEHPIGEAGLRAFDNEQPSRRLRLAPTWLSRRPVSNAEFAAFMTAGGYDTPDWWSRAGWRWRQSLKLAAPEGWRRAPRGWLEVGPAGAAAPVAGAAVCGLSRFEAEAYARWAGGRLPHEYEWEAAARAGLLEGTGQSWEWCGNRFHPYPGFRAFPYDGYSLPWFDGRHYVLRGGSRHSHESLLRPSLRNFYTAEKRHVFAGVRVAYDSRPGPRRGGGNTSPFS